MESLKYFFQGYFHQDWMIDYSSYEEAVDDFCNNEAEELIRSVRADLLNLLQRDCLDDSTFIDFGGYIKPSSISSSAKDWVKSIIDLIERKL